MQCRKSGYELQWWKRSSVSQNDEVVRCRVVMLVRWKKCIPWQYYCCLLIISLKGLIKWNRSSFRSNASFAEILL